MTFLSQKVWRWHSIAVTVAGTGELFSFPVERLPLRLLFSISCTKTFGGMGWFPSSLD